MLLTRCILVFATCALVAHGARLKKRLKPASSADKMKHRQKSPEAPPCAEATQHIMDSGAVLADPEFTHQPTFSWTAICLYTIPKDNPMVPIGSSMRRDPNHLLMQCKKRPDRGRTYAECQLSRGGSIPCVDCGLPDCAGVPKLVSAPGWENWQAIGIEQEECSISGFIERFKPLFNYPNMAQNPNLNIWPKHVELFNELPDYLQTGEAFRKTQSFFWRAYRIIKENRPGPQPTKGLWEEIWNRNNGDGNLEAMNWAVSNALAVQGSGAGPMMSLAHHMGVTTKLAAHLGPIEEGQRMTEDQCRAGMLLFNCPSNDVRFTKGFPVGTWDRFGRPRQEEDRCKCTRRLM